MDWTEAMRDGVEIDCTYNDLVKFQIGLGFVFDELITQEETANTPRLSIKMLTNLLSNIKKFRQ